MRDAGLVLFLMWLVAAIAVGYAATTRGRGFFAWALCGVLLSPLLGFVLLALAPVRFVPTVGEHRQCPACMEWVHAKASKCRHCHTDLTADAGAQSVPATDLRNDEWTARIVVGLVLLFVAAIVIGLK